MNCAKFAIGQRVQFTYGARGVRAVVDVETVFDGTTWTHIYKLAPGGTWIAESALQIPEPEPAEPVRAFRMLNGNGRTILTFMANGTPVIEEIK